MHDWGGPEAFVLEDIIFTSSLAVPIRYLGICAMVDKELYKLLASTTRGRLRFPLSHGEVDDMMERSTVRTIDIGRGPV